MKPIIRKLGGLILGTTLLVGALSSAAAARVHVRVYYAYRRPVYSYYYYPHRYVYYYPHRYVYYYPRSYYWGWHHHRWHHRDWD